MSDAVVINWPDIAPNQPATSLQIIHPTLGTMFTIEAYYHGTSGLDAYEIEIIDHFNEEVIYSNTISIES